LVVLFAVLVIFVILLEVPSLLREKSYKELVVFSVFLLLGVYLGMVQLYDWPFYNPIPEWAAMMEESK
jgi:hypothetical protein